jgi:hypothetical protein
VEPAHKGGCFPVLDVYTMSAESLFAQFINTEEKELPILPSTGDQMTFHLTLYGCSLDFRGVPVIIL